MGLLNTLQEVLISPTENVDPRMTLRIGEVNEQRPLVIDAPVVDGHVRVPPDQGQHVRINVLFWRRQIRDDVVLESEPGLEVRQLPRRSAMPVYPLTAVGILLKPEVEGMALHGYPQSLIHLVICGICTIKKK